jgi:hypothetical protein
MGRGGIGCGNLIKYASYKLSLAHQPAGVIREQLSMQSNR